jgi:hypothetical protein
MGILNNMACTHGNRPPCDLEHSKPELNNTKRHWGSVIKYLDPSTIQTISDTYKSINEDTVEVI